jgi:hypothetical protein
MGHLLGIKVDQQEEEAVMRYVITPKRTFVKALIYRVWIFTATYLLLILTGQSWANAIVPTLSINFVLTFTYYSYDRLWQRIEWGIEPVRKRKKRR